MAIQKFTVSNDPDIYEAWPDVVLANPEKMVCVFSECTHHGNRSYTRVMLTESTDRGRTWTPKHPLTEGTAGKDYYYNCARINRLSDGRLVITIDRVFHKNDESKEQNAHVLLYFSADEGNTWEGPFSTPMNGIVPDKLIELPGGRLIVSAHYRSNGRLAQFMHYSDDGGESWSRRITVAESPQFNLCEVSMLPLGGNTVVAFLRENCRGSRRTAEAFIRDFLATRSGEFLFAPVLREGVDAYIHRSTGGLAPGYDCAARSGCGLP